jgi:hypothetical protein
MEERVASRLRALLKRIDKWADNPEPELTKEWIDTARDSEELILDIEQCLKSILEQAVKE